MSDDDEYLYAVLNCEDLSGEATDAAFRSVAALRKRAEQAEAALARVRELLDEEQRGYNPPLGLISRIRTALGGDGDE